MVNPVTVNLGIIIPLTGADVDTWGEDDVNPNMVAFDGLLGGVQTIGLTNVPVTLTSPAGFVPTPSPGPTQSQNAVIKFTGTLTGNVTVTLPLPGRYVIDNQTTGNFLITLQGVTATEVIALPPGEVSTIYNDGARVKFVDLGRVGSMEFWAGITAIPAWVAACTVKPYLPCDLSTATYNFSEFPALAARLLGQFGGNGITTFAAPDLRGRVPLAYDGTGTRITEGGCGINGQTIGASLDTQTVTLTTPQIPIHAHANSLNDPGHSHIEVGSETGGASGYMLKPNNGASGVSSASSNSTLPAVTGMTITNANAGGGLPHNNVQPSLVTGIWVIKT